MHGWEHVEKLVEGIAIIQVIEKRLSWNPCLAKHESTTHKLWIRLDWTMIERQHD